MVLLRLIPARSWRTSGLEGDVKHASTVWREVIRFVIRFGLQNKNKNGHRNSASKRLKTATLNDPIRWTKLNENHPETGCTQIHPVTGWISSWNVSQNWRVNSDIFRVNSPAKNFTWEPDELPQKLDQNARWNSLSGWVSPDRRFTMSVVDLNARIAESISSRAFGPHPRWFSLPVSATAA